VGILAAAELNWVEVESLPAEIMNQVVVENLAVVVSN